MVNNLVVVMSRTGYCRHDEGEGEVGVQQHHGVVDLTIQGAAVGVHHIHLPPQVVPVLAPAVVLFQPEPSWNEGNWQQADQTKSQASTAGEAKDM